MRFRLQHILLLMLCTAFASAEPPGIDQSLEFVIPATGAKFIRWHGKPGRTYFIQVSDPADHLKTWLFQPIIELGSDIEISHEVLATAEKGFFRLKYTDQVPAPGETIDTADFDHDGIPNLYEVQTLGTDPLDKNSAGGDFDNDGLPDGWEKFHFGSLGASTLSADPDGDGLSNQVELMLGMDPSAAFEAGTSSNWEIHLPN
jgi:hypothetical protein